MAFWAMCDKREIVCLRYGKVLVIPLDPSDNPLKDFEDRDVIKSVFCFFNFILWFRTQPSSFKWSLAIHARYPDLWKRVSLSIGNAMKGKKKVDLNAKLLEF